MGHKTMNGEDYYYIHWKRYPAEDDSWEPRSNLSLKTLQLWEQTVKAQRSTRRSRQ